MLTITICHFFRLHFDPEISKYDLSRQPVMFLEKGEATLSKHYDEIDVNFEVKIMMTNLTFQHRPLMGDISALPSRWGRKYNGGEGAQRMIR